MAIIVLVIILALVGFADSLYFVMVHYGFTDAEPPEVPLCPDDGHGTCATVARSPQSEFFGVPSSLFGLAFYGAVLAAAGMRLMFGFWPLPQILAAVSVASAVVSLYLAYTLVFQIQILCPLCFTAHAINLSLATIFVIMLVRH
ncbi:vitamin K epoxide reductase family protein [bacterium]|nr:vitamin K epoxide reductase family protein [bacterium]